MNVFCIYPKVVCFCLAVESQCFARQKKSLAHYWFYREAKEESRPFLAIGRRSGTEMGACISRQRMASCIKAASE